ncbi:MAG: PAS domain-containing protein [Bacteroidales bacterium]
MGNVPDFTKESIPDSSEWKETISKLQEKVRFLELENADLRELYEEHRLIANYTCDWEYWLTPEGNVRWMSPSVRDITGYSAEEFIKEKQLIFMLVYPEDTSQFSGFIEKTLSFAVIGQSLSFRILTRSKQLRHCEINGRGVYDPTGRYLGQRYSIRDITKLSGALGHIKLLEDDKNWETKAKKRYKEELAVRDRELVSSLVSASEQTALLLHLKKVVGSLQPLLPPHAKAKTETVLHQIDELFRRQFNGNEEFKLYFEKVYPGFFSRLEGKYPGLTARERRLCAYLLLKLSTKEIAGLLHIAPASAEISRVRLRKKLGLSRQTSLSDFLSKL